MSVQALRDAREDKYFYRNGFRRATWILLLSLFINLILIAAIYNVIVSRVEPNYYATSGIKAPILLKALSEPNYSSKPLLASDPTVEDTKEAVK